MKVITLCQTLPYKLKHRRTINSACKIRALSLLRIEEKIPLRKFKMLSKNSVLTKMYFTCSPLNSAQLEIIF